jgi:hypothetical protein
MGPALSEDYLRWDDLLSCLGVSISLNSYIETRLPSVFLAPSLLPGPSLAEFTAPWDLCEACRMAGCDRTRARKAVRKLLAVAIDGRMP